MKNYLGLFFLLFIISNTDAQNVPNGDFESWTNYGLYSYPDFWLTTDSISTYYGQHSVTRDTINSNTGESALEMQTWSVSVETFPAAATNGNLNISTAQFGGGSPDTVRYGILTGMYKYFPHGDACLILVRLSKWNGTSRDSVGGGTWSASDTASTFTPFSVHLSYPLSENPDTVLIVILTSGYGTSHAGTTLYIDDLNLSGLAGINELQPNLVSINAFPNPASDYLTIDAKWNMPVRGMISILDINGKLLQSIPMTSSRQRIDVSSLASGNYFYELIDDEGNKLYAAKFSVSH